MLALNSLTNAPAHTQLVGLKKERVQIEGLNAEMGSKSSQLESWLSRNKPKAERVMAADGVDWDEGGGACFDALPVLCCCVVRALYV